jgi:hypothetical protein
MPRLVLLGLALSLLGPAATVMAQGTESEDQYFIVIDNALLAFLWVGQDTPLFDPTSFHYLNNEEPGAVE